MLPNDFYVRNLSQAWQHLNRSLFGGALLVAPTFLVVEIDHHAADWNPARRLIRFSRSFVDGHCWLAVIEVLKHEMAHQYVTDVLGADDETAHGPAFQMVCDRYAIDGRARGTVRATHDDHILDKVRKLFRLGDSPNEHEAKAALSKAQRLLDEHGLSVGDLEPSTAEFGAAFLGEVVLTKKPEEHRHVASHILSRFFRVRTIWIQTLDRTGRAGLQLEASGRVSDLAIAEYAHDFLHAEADRLWLRAGRGGTRERLDFVEGVMRGFLASLVEHEKVLGGAQTPGLALVAAQGRLDDYFERRHPRTRSVKPSGRQRGVRFGEGVSAGRHISLNDPLTGNSPKLLGPG